MTLRRRAVTLLTQESQALLTRLDRVKPFVLQETMAPAAAPSLAAQSAIERFLFVGRREMRDMIGGYLRWLHGTEGQAAPLPAAQQRFALLRMRFNTLLSQFDIFADVMTQRSEYDTGVWLSGLDLLAADALTLRGDYFRSPPVVCYLDRGHGAAIRRTRTRLPGGGKNPVAVIMVPRERMVSNSLASSLVHEVGHQGAALLDLIASLRPALHDRQRLEPEQRLTWGLWDRWLSEILSDFWSVARVGVAAPVGLMGVVSLPRAFVFRVSLDDPHPIPWIRVKLSCAMGAALYPDPQWAQLAAIWEALYPLENLDSERQALLRSLEADMGRFVNLLIKHRPRRLHGQSLGEALASADRQPAHLRALYRRWRGDPLAQMSRNRPALVFAVVGQARADGILSPRGESRLLADLLTRWAVRSTLDTSYQCAQLDRAPGVALAV
jgi:hypothetical protein